MGEQTDRLAKEGGGKEQPDEPVSFDEIITVIKAHQHDTRHPQHPASCPNDIYHFLTREEQFKIFLLRTGHNRLNHHHLHTTFSIVQTGECPCNMGQQTADHVLPTCPTYAAARDIWPSKSQHQLFTDTW